ncbi:winged helix-turn-helix domain-containing protein [Klebsiella aerogenes]|uniref:winged helix-turn-helix domain-containing protein n=1 Tax=Klebsiella aerogenes TaxID=548 RepID=UPI00254D87DF|nr:winged helix-turn-helix domain-containing protein [Klebsiella aerogenes]MDK6932423.1 winged helix-turn-helix domain-containing protein [Klebsiella aerogenes]
MLELKEFANIEWNNDKDNIRIYGFIINECFLYHLSSRTLIGLDIGDKVNEEAKKVVRLRKTMSFLFECLLYNAGEVIPDNGLLTEVWEKKGLRGTRHRLWEVITTLNKILESVGAGTDLILRVNHRGYMLNKKKVTVLFY